jgi:DNA-binding transcriptional LysR family regulator
MLSVHQLRLLRELARRGTIAAVAEALAYSASAVSQQLSLLERRAGVALLARTGRRVTLTPAALALVRHAEVILERLETAEAELADSREGAAGDLRIGLYPSAARLLSRATLTALRAAHPRLVPWVQETDPADAPDALRAGRLDVALVHDYDLLPARPEPGIESRRVFTERLYLAVPAGLPTDGGGDGGECADGGAAAVGPDPVARFRDAAWILPTPGTLCHAMVLHLWATRPLPGGSWHRVDDFDTALALVAAGCGVAVVPQLFTLPPPDGIALLPLSGHRHSALAHRAGAAAHPAVRAFEAALRTALPTELPGLAAP